MNSPTAKLARSITWASSKQSYLTARLLADRDLAEDCLRAYAYFRWADDMIDCRLRQAQERRAFIEHQKDLILRLYRGERPTAELSPEEDMLADLIAHDRTPDSGLRSFIDNFMAVIEFDADRQGDPVSCLELDSYTDRLATAVMDGIQYFIGNDHAYAQSPERSLAVKGAHITHMLRDMREDLAAGLVNIPVEVLEGHAFSAQEPDGPALRAWVRDQVALARECFRRGKPYIDSLQVLRCKLAGVWYCARFECILEAIERDGYRLRLDYPERCSLKAWLEMIRLGLVTIWEHFTRRYRRSAFNPAQRPVQAGYPKRLSNPATTKILN